MPRFRYQLVVIGQMDAENDQQVFRTLMTQVQFSANLVPGLEGIAPTCEVVGGIQIVGAHDTPNLKKH